MREIPVLRFKEFKNSWKKTKLDSITEKVNSGKTPLGGESVYVEKGILFIRSQNVLDNKLSLENSTYITEEVNITMKNSIVKARDILLNITGASLGRSCVVPTDFIIGNVNQHVCIVRLDEYNDPYFLQPIFASKKGQDLFTSLQTGSGREGLNFQSIKNLSLLFPSLLEQQKIASFLSAVDEKIQQLIRKKELLEQYKKGVMQQLFRLNHDSSDLRDSPDVKVNQGNQKNHHQSQFRPLRFKDENGKDYPKWEEKRLDEVADFRRGSFPQPYGLAKWFDEINGLPFVQVYDVADNMLLKPSTKTKISTLAAEQSVFVKEGTLIITIQGSIGRIAKTQYDAYVDRTLLIFQSYKKPIDVDYFKFVVSLLFEIEKTKAPGGTIKTITKEALSSFKIMIPQIDEQQKIANYLSAIVTKIENVTNQITQTQTFKKGLLQQMFV